MAAMLPNNLLKMNSCKSSKFSKFTLPKIKRVYPSLLANSLVSVQPLSQPASLIYYLRHRYSGSFILATGFYTIAGMWNIDGEDHLVVRELSGDPDEECVYIEVNDNKWEPGEPAENAVKKFETRIEFESGEIKEGYQHFLKDCTVMVYDADGTSKKIEFVAKNMAAICLKI